MSERPATILITLEEWERFKALTADLAALEREKDEAYGVLDSRLDVLGDELAAAEHVIANVRALADSCTTKYQAVHPDALRALLPAAPTEATS